MTKKEQREKLRARMRMLWPHIRNNPACWQPVWDILDIIGDMHNRPPVARGQVTARPVTPVMRAVVIWLHTHYPDWNYEQIARSTGLDNIGRISEILAGVRT